MKASFLSFPWMIYDTIWFGHFAAAISAIGCEPSILLPVLDFTRSSTPPTSEEDLQSEELTD